MEILIENKAVQEQFDRWCRHFGEIDPYSVNGNIGIRDVLRAHFLIADHFIAQGHGIAALGPRDPNLLHSAVYRQFTGYGGNDKWESSYERCATLLFGLVKDHPFHDANKRTALLVLIYFLTKTNRVPTVGQRELEDFVVEIAEGHLKRYRRLKALEQRTDDPEVYFIADYLRRNSRPTDKRCYTITYRELDSRLKSFGYCFQNPYKNFIDVGRFEQVRSFLGLGKARTEFVRVAHIAFPGWKKQVPKSVITTVRRATGLTAEKGFDSASFFGGTDPLYSLIAEYSSPLERLAYR